MNRHLVTFTQLDIDGHNELCCSHCGTWLVFQMRGFLGYALCWTMCPECD